MKKLLQENEHLKNALCKRELEPDWLSKKMEGAGVVGKQRSQLLDKDVSKVSRSRQCELLGVPRSISYYKPQKKDEDGENKAKEMIKAAYSARGLLERVAAKKA